MRQIILAVLLGTAASLELGNVASRRAALLSFMAAHNLKVSDVLRLCAALVDDSERV